MDAPDLTDFVARAINGADNEWASAPRTEQHDPWHLFVADAVLAVPAIADALERDAKVAEMLETANIWTLAHIYALYHPEDADDIAALYPETGKGGA